MIVIICAMEKEIEAFLKIAGETKIIKGKRLKYQDSILKIDYHAVKIADQDVVICQSGVGMTYAALGTQLAIQKFKPELVINVGCAGSLNEDVHVGDIIFADRVADWRYDVFDWERGLDSVYTSYPCDDRIAKIAGKLKSKASIKVGPIVSANEFIYKKSQLKELKKYYPEALCGEMEGCAIANTCYAYDVKCSIIRSISDESLVNGGYKDYYFNVYKQCDAVADLCLKILKRY